MAYLPNEEFKKIIKTIQKDGKSIKMTPKKLISYFGVTSRRSNVIWWVDRALKENNLITIPNYKSAWVHAEIELTSEKNHKDEKDKENSKIDNIIPKIKLLKAANTLPVFITKNDTVEKAMTIMMKHDFSQLPVMNSLKSKEVDGIISWHSIGWQKAIGKKSDKVNVFMNKECTILKDTTPLLDAVTIIKEKEVVLIRKKDKSIGGLVTIADIADEFYSLSEPFLIIGQIEASIREIIEDKFSQEELKEVKYGDDNRDVQSISDLTFNEYIQLLRKGNNWEKLNLPLDKDEFTKRLEEVRDIRNDVMHFNTDNLEEKEKNILRNTAIFLGELIRK